MQDTVGFGPIFSELSFSTIDHLRHHHRFAHIRPCTGQTIFVCFLTAQVRCVRNVRLQSDEWLPASRFVKTKQNKTKYQQLNT